MPAYNFKAQFVEPIRAGTKHTTIRPCRKRPTREGDTLHLFTGMRTKACVKIGAYRCVKVQPMIIWPIHMQIILDGIAMSYAALFEIATADGFVNVADLFKFFSDVYGTNRLTMELITWEPLS